jgi:hypothetical protein
MTPRQVWKFCALKPEAMAILKAAMEGYSLFHMTLHSFIGPVTLIGVVVFRQDAPYG